MASPVTKQLLVVIGATGAQGGSVITSILSDPRTASMYNIRAITRDVTKPNSRALVARGCEVVSADLMDKPSLVRAFKGADSVFAVTDYWQLKPHEFEAGMNIVEAAEDTKIKHLVWSTLINVTKVSNGVLTKVNHFDTKAKIEEHIRTKTSIPASFFLPGYYITNLSLRPSSLNNNNFVLSLPMPANAPIPLLATANDTGKFVKAILLNKSKTLGKHVLGATDYYTPQRLVEEFEKVKPICGEGIKFVQQSGHEFKDLLMNAGGRSEEVAEELLQNMRLIPEFGYYGGESLDWSHSLLEEPLTTWEEHLRTSPPYNNLE